MGAELNQKLFSAADNLRSKMDASEYKNYLLGLIFYKYLSDRLLEQVVLLADESLEEYDTVSKQTMLYRELLSDEESKEDLIATIVDILGYAHIQQSSRVELGKKFESGFYAKPDTSSPQAVPAAGEPTISMTALLELLKDADPEMKAKLRLALLT